MPEIYIGVAAGAFVAGAIFMGIGMMFFDPVCISGRALGLW